MLLGLWKEREGQVLSTGDCGLLPLSDEDEESPPTLNLRFSSESDRRDEALAACSSPWRRMPPPLLRSELRLQPDFSSMTERGRLGLGGPLEGEDSGPIPLLRGSRTLRGPEHRGQWSILEEN